MKKASFDKTNGTYRQGEINQDYDVLVEVFGEPERSFYDKVSCEWAIEFDNGTIATIYDWKSNPSYFKAEYGYGGGVRAEHQTNWHIGGHSIDAVVRVVEAIESHTKEDRKMGNRAVIQFGKGESPMGIYLHWQGSPEYVDAYLEYARSLGLRYDDYGIARLTQIIGNYIGGTLSLGVDLAKHLDRDNYDNGTYVINDEFKIEERLFVPEGEKDYDSILHLDVYYEVVVANDQFFR